MPSLPESVQEFAQTPSSRRYPQQGWNLPVWAVSENVPHQESPSYTQTCRPYDWRGEAPTGTWCCYIINSFYQALTCDPYKRPWAVKYVGKKWWSEALRSIFDARIKQKDSPATYVMLISTRVLNCIMFFWFCNFLIPEIKNQSQPQVSHQNQARGKVLAVWYLRRKIVNSPELHQKS